MSLVAKLEMETLLIKWDIKSVFWLFSVHHEDFHVLRFTFEGRPFLMIKAHPWAAPFLVQHLNALARFWNGICKSSLAVATSLTILMIICLPMNVSLLLTSFFELSVEQEKKWKVRLQFSLGHWIGHHPQLVKTASGYVV